MTLYGVTSTSYCSDCGTFSVAQTVVQATPDDTPLLRFLIAQHFSKRSEITCKRCQRPLRPDEGPAEITIRVQPGTIDELREQGFDV